MNMLEMQVNKYVADITNKILNDLPELEINWYKVLIFPLIN